VREKRKSIFMMVLGMAIALMTLNLFSDSFVAIHEPSTGSGAYQIVKTARKLSFYKITVRIPNGGENYNPGQLYAILWKIVEVQGTGGAEEPVSAPIADHYVRLYYSTDSGAIWHPIEAGAFLPTSPGQFRWKVPLLNNLPNVHQGRIKAELVNKRSSSQFISTDMSDSDFNFTAKNKNNNLSTSDQSVDSFKIELTNPNGGEKLWRGGHCTAEYKIYRKKEGNPDTYTLINQPVGNHCLKLFYSLDSGITWVFIINIDDMSSKFDWEYYHWTVPEQSTKKGRFKIALIQDWPGGKTVANDASDFNFQIRLP